MLPRDESTPFRSDAHKDLVQSQLERILASPTFKNSMRMKRFLLFTVEHSLAGTAECIKEYTLGIEVFDRPATFDQRSDAVVRVEARRLRMKLNEYYETYGSQDPLRIDFPKGSYAPVFVSHTKAPQPVNRRPYLYAAAGVVLITLLWGTFEAGRHSTAAGIVEGESPIASLAVLPFQDLSEHHDQDYFCRGVREEILHSMAQIPGLRVSALRNAHADHVLEGSVREDGERRRVTIKLVRVADSSQVWSRTFDSEMAAELDVEREIARNTATRVRFQLAAVKGGRGFNKPPEDPEAHTLYLMGRFYANKMTPVTTHQAIEYFQQSVRKDPKYARAYAGLADGYNLALLFQNLPGERASQEARSAARQALSLDESISEAHVSLARTLMWADFNWLSAEQELQRAIELDPQYAEAYQVYAWNLVYRGRYAEALDTIRKAVNLEPNSARIRTVMAMILIKARQFDRAVQVSREAVQIDPSYARGYEALGRAALLNGDAEGAIQAISRAVELNANGEPKARLGWAYGSLGRRQDALRILHELSRGPRGKLGIASIYTALGERDQAFRCIEEAWKNHAFMGELGDPDWDNLRHDTRYEQVLARIHLAPV